MATLGTAKVYCPSSETWIEYIERFEFLLMANKVTGDAAKRATLLSVVGSHTFRTLRSLLTPVKPGETCMDIVTKMTEHFSPRLFRGHVFTAVPEK